MSLSATYIQGRVVGRRRDGAGTPYALLEHTVSPSAHASTFTEVTQTLLTLELYSKAPLPTDMSKTPTPLV